MQKQANYCTTNTYSNTQSTKGKWQISSANEFGRLAQGVGGRIKGTNTIIFICMEDVPKERMKDVTYGQFVCMVWPEKADQS